jgi:methyltransferase
VTAADWIVLAVALQRLGELAYARGNERALRAQGGIEVGARHYPLLMVLHASWLAAVWWGGRSAVTLDLSWLTAFFVLQTARIWVISALGRYWTTRIITVPGQPLVRRGPYRFFRHPNYLIVVLEIAVLPLCFGLWAIAIVFSTANLALLAHRIRVEDGALGPRRALDTVGKRTDL